MIIDSTNASTEQGRPFLKSGSYSIRCLNCEKQISKKKNPMLVFTYEICSPEQVTDAEGKPVRIAGLQLMDWIVFSGNNEKSISKLRALNELTDQPLKIDIDDPAQLKGYVGKAIKVRLVTEGGILTDENTGEPITKNGAPVTANNYRLREILDKDEGNTIPADAVAY